MTILDFRFSQTKMPRRNGNAREEKPSHFSTFSPKSRERPSVPHEYTGQTDHFVWPCSNRNNSEVATDDFVGESAALMVGLYFFFLFWQWAVSGDAALLHHVMHRAPGTRPPAAYLSK
jgi:hypothetical protein